MGAEAIADEILRERKRQVVVEGWSRQHDDTHDRGELARAAAAYAYEASGDRQINVVGHTPERGYFTIGWFTPALALFPFHRSWWKPKSPRENLVKAGALIIAEIERLDRAAAREQGDPAEQAAPAEAPAAPGAQS